ncbi:hypothetical protein NE237_009315 [Protea cynaroides]|uniref:Ammonium transporter AmtB-like domain-containing protein n=1 Tax=Protea cynaroides TaxID=273540 RepID=A0A9Q0R063_9MAGN|nr:hypothetical protein NE237_009315 [Protea cynaroides]
MTTPIAYQEQLPAVPGWLNKGDSAWQMTAATLVGLQSLPGLVILYGGIIKKKWAVNSAFMALYAFAAVLICWVLVCFRMAFGDKLLSFWGKGAPALSQHHLVHQAAVPETAHHHYNGSIETPMNQPFYPMASLVYFQFTFAAIMLILIAGSVLACMNIKAWMAFVPLWLIFSYTVGAFSLWGGGFLYHWGVIDYSGAYWVGPRMKSDRERFPPNNGLLMFARAGLHWMEGCSRDDDGLVCITPGAGVVQSWVARVMGILSGSIPWFTMMILHCPLLLQKSDDTLGVLHTHAVAGLLGGVLARLLAEPVLSNLILPETGSRGAFYGKRRGMQLIKQVVAALFVIGWNVVSTKMILLAIHLFILLRMPEEELMIGDDAVRGEEAYALWGDGEKYDAIKHGHVSSCTHHKESVLSQHLNGPPTDVTIQL